MMLPRLMLVVDFDGVGRRDFAQVVLAAAAGARDRLIVQVRERRLDQSWQFRPLLEIRQELPESSLLVLNDQAVRAKDLRCGLHLPAMALELPEPRPVLLGRSVHNAEEAERAIVDRCDYAVVGTVFETASHPGRSGAGLGSLSELCGQLAPMPCYAIGGIDALNAGDCVGAGAWGVAVRSAILGASDPRSAARELSDAVGEAVGLRL